MTTVSENAKLGPINAASDAISALDAYFRADQLAVQRDLRDEFTAVYREDILKTQALLDRDLSSWLP